MNEDHAYREIGPDGTITLFKDLLRRLGEPGVNLHIGAPESRDSGEVTCEAVLFTEKHRLEQQRLKALQAVNTAEAEAKAKHLAADAEAYKVVTEATAEADAIRLVTQQLAQSPRYIELQRVKQWNGVLPRTALSGDAQVLLSLDRPQGRN